MVGIPYSQFDGTVNGVLHTVNTFEMDDAKRSIEEKLKKLEDVDLEIRYGQTYFWKAGK